MSKYQIGEYGFCKVCGEPHTINGLCAKHTPPPKPIESLDEILSNHEDLCEDQSLACGDCRRLKQALEAYITERERLARIDELESIAETDDGALCLVGDDLGGVTIKDRLTTLKVQLEETPSYDTK